MRSRGLVVVLALVLATIAVAGLFLYTRSVRQNALTSGGVSEVVVSKVNIPANSDLNQYISDGNFVLKTIPSDDLVAGAITQVADLRNRRNSVPIIEGEQIPLARVQGGKVAGGTLGIPDGYEALTVSLEAPAAVSGAFSAGDDLTVYATFDDVPVSALTKKQQKIFVKQTSANSVTITGNRAAQLAGQTTTVTAVLVPQAKVLRVTIPQTQGGVSGSVSTPTGNVVVALALTPVDAQKFVYAVDQGTVYLSLLPPNANGKELPPMTVQDVIGQLKVQSAK